MQAKIVKEPTQIGIVGFVLKGQRTGVVEKYTEFAWPSRQQGGKSIELHLCDLVVLLLGRGLGTIPGKRAAKKVDENICEGFQVVTARLFGSLMAVERGIWGGTCEDAIMLSVWDVEMGPGISVLLGKTEIDDVDIIAMRTHTDRKIAGFDVAVNEVGRVYVLYA